MTCHLCAKSSVQMPEATHNVSMLDVAALACDFCHDNLYSAADLKWAHFKSAAE